MRCGSHLCIGDTFSNARPILQSENFYQKRDCTFQLPTFGSAVRLTRASLRFRQGPPSAGDGRNEGRLSQADTRTDVIFLLH